MLCNCKLPIYGEFAIFFSLLLVSSFSPMYLFLLLRMQIGLRSEVFVCLVGREEFIFPFFSFFCSPMELFLLVQNTDRSEGFVCMGSDMGFLLTYECFSCCFVWLLIDHIFNHFTCFFFFFLRGVWLEIGN